MNINKALWIGLLTSWLAIAAKAEGPDFTLIDHEHLDAITPYTNGDLRDFRGRAEGGIYRLQPALRTISGGICSGFTRFMLGLTQPRELG